MKWDDLRVFLQVARQQRLLSAARQLALDPATVGRRITALETALGAKLFDRSPQGYALTEAGSNLLAHAQSMESLAAAASEEVGGHADRLSGHVRIGAPDGVSNFLLPRVCADLNRDNPDLSVQIVALPRMFSLSKREADLAITLSPPSAGRVKIQKIGGYRLRLYATRDWADSVRPRSLSDLRSQRGIGYIPDMIFDKELDYFASIGRDMAPALASNSLIVQLNWALAGAGYCILPDFVAEGFDRLVPLLRDELSLSRSLYLIRHQDDARVARISKTAAHLVTGMREDLARLARLA
ncbi:LysR family transcriptional regulator [Oceanomicrobium pacificus]|uniref:LysR family transcriptional regulator n=1 Tax=Oceanomicrobium pacificus TaxID=2692916 RepID=A0A6B0TWJ9_9RHOB|nr:LysR family transcriptional regulator [Oceanomicrobium pacificus]MXU65878.1 LysR family transcriptional regulator [Oceanomicrobium pacificus]